MARMVKQSVFALDEDLKRAYDQTERFVKEMALRRFGMPEEMLEWLLDFDRENKNIVLTAFGETEPFEAAQYQIMHTYMNAPNVGMMRTVLAIAMPTT